jgi:hypothetical protein
MRTHPSQKAVYAALHQSYRLEIADILQLLHDGTIGYDDAYKRIMWYLQCAEHDGETHAKQAAYSAFKRH